MVTALRLVILAASLGLVVSSMGADVERADLNPTEFKAAFLSKIPSYITWPDADNQLIIGILGEDPAEALLRQLLKDRKVHGREVIVKVFKAVEEVQRCHVLFVPATHVAQWTELYKRIEPVGLLTVGETNDFIELGGVFNLSLKDQKLVISRKNAKKARLEIDAKLLKFSTVK